jgi:hypothetical protein
MKEWELARETEVLGIKLPQHHFVHQKPHTIISLNPLERGQSPKPLVLLSGSKHYIPTVETGPVTPMTD